MNTTKQLSSDQHGKSYVGIFWGTLVGIASVYGLWLAARLVFTWLGQGH
jgi:hypothetical protein